MKHRYLEVTFRNGKPLAAYLYLPRPPLAKVARTSEASDGLRVDLDAAGEPLGIEITAPTGVSIEQLNQVLISLRLAPIGADEWAPLAA